MTWYHVLTQFFSNLLCCFSNLYSSLSAWVMKILIASLMEVFCGGGAAWGLQRFNGSIGFFGFVPDRDLRVVMVRRWCGVGLRLYRIGIGGLTTVIPGCDYTTLCRVVIWGCDGLAVACVERSCGYVIFLKLGCCGCLGCYGCWWWQWSGGVSGVDLRQWCQMRVMVIGDSSGRTWWGTEPGTGWWLIEEQKNYRWTDNWKKTYSDG